MSNETLRRLAIGTVAFALGVLSMLPPSGVLLDTLYPDAYQRWVCPHPDDATCKKLGLDGPERRLKP